MLFPSAPRRLPLLLATAFVATAALACSEAPGDDTNQADNQSPNQSANHADNQSDNPPPLDAASLRVATFNASLFRGEQGQLIADLEDGDEQAAEIAEILQVTRPDVVLLNEFDYDADGQAAQIFADEYLGQSQGDQDRLDYPHVYAVATNTGQPSGVDLNGDGEADGAVGTEEYAQNAYGYGVFPGQYGFAVFSKYPLLTDEMRSFQEFLWDDLEDNLMPPDFYSDEAIDIFRLSSKNHIDLPVDVDGHRLHLLASHPTPPAFDGPEQRNVRRNADEINLWRAYLDDAAELVDDQGQAGGLAEGSHFVIVGDLNADPNDSDEAGAMADLIAHPRLTDPLPDSEGGADAGESAGGRNDVHDGEHRHDTAQFSRNVTGNLRVDYALPSTTMTVDDAAVFWPAGDDAHGEIVKATDHRLVWVDLTLPATGD